MYWRTAKHEDTCAERSRNIPLTESEGLDMLFFNDPAKQAFKASNKYKIYPDKESSVMVIVQLDPMMTSMFDRFKDSFLGYHDYQLSQR